MARRLEVKKTLLMCLKCVLTGHVPRLVYSMCQNVDVLHIEQIKSQRFKSKSSGVFSEQLLCDSVRAFRLVSKEGTSAQMNATDTKCPVFDGTQA